jgi:hypothetical protein
MQRSAHCVADTCLADGFARIRIKEFIPKMARAPACRKRCWTLFKLDQIGQCQAHQKPRSARPTQLNANIDEAIAVNVTMVLMDRMK